MRAWLANMREGLTSSLWFVPAMLVVLAVGLAAFLLYLDDVLPQSGGLGPWLFRGTASSAQSLLQVIAGSLITVVALAFSVTIVAVQQASTQFSPRVIRNFMRDQGNRFVFGTYIATFVYALLVLRQVREADATAAGEFVPALAITGAVVLALLCIALLIFFIHHIATSLQVSTITDEVRQELLDGIDGLFPKRLGEPVREGDDELYPALPHSPPSVRVTAKSAGFIRVLDEEQLLDALGEEVLFARVRPRVGEYVVNGGLLVELWFSKPLDAQGVEEKVRRSFAFAHQRSPHQDILFSIRQLVDIALKALSPGINDPTTAEYCLSHLGDAVAQLAERSFPPAWRRSPRTGTTLLVNRPSFATIVDAAFSQIRREAANDVHVTSYLLGVLAQIAPRVATRSRALAVRQQVEEVLAALPQQGFSQRDQAALRRQVDEVLAISRERTTQLLAGTDSSLEERVPVGLDVGREDYASRA